MAADLSPRTWNMALILGLVATLLGVAALLIDLIQGDAFNPIVLPAIGAGLIIASIALAQRKKAKD